MFQTIVLSILTIIGIAVGLGGERYGIGAGHEVYVYDEAGHVAAFATTNESSQVVVQVPEGSYDIEIEVHRTSPLYVWDCRDFNVPVDQGEETVAVRCVPRWRLGIPWLLR